MNELPFFDLRGWQVHCFSNVQGSPYIIINAPMGSGKSFAICALVTADLEAHPSKKAIVAVPQTLIAASFRNNRISLPNGDKIHFDPGCDLCAPETNHNTRRLIEFLEDKPRALNSRIALCTHATLVRAFKRHPNSFRKIALWIDEEHHVHHHKVTTAKQRTNELGSLVRFALSNQDRQISIGLTTATFFRGNRTTILPPASLQHFKRFTVPYDEYMRDLGLTFNNDWIVSV